MDLLSKCRENVEELENFKYILKLILLYDVWFSNSI